MSELGDALVEQEVRDGQESSYAQEQQYEDLQEQYEDLLVREGHELILQYRDHGDLTWRERNALAAVCRFVESRVWS